MTLELNSSFNAKHFRFVNISFNSTFPPNQTKAIQSAYSISESVGALKLSVVVVVLQDAYTSLRSYVMETKKSLYS